MTRRHRRATRRAKYWKIIPLVMRTVAAELRAAGEMPAPAHFGLLSILSASARGCSRELAAMQGVSLPTMSNSISAMVERGWVRRTAPRRRSARRDDRGDQRRARPRSTAWAAAREAHLADVLAPLDLARPQAAAGRPRRAAEGLRRRAGVRRAQGATNRGEAKVVFTVDCQKGSYDRHDIGSRRTLRLRPKASRRARRRGDLFAARDLRGCRGAPAMARRGASWSGHRRGRHLGVHVDRRRPAGDARSADRAMDAMKSCGRHPSRRTIARQIAIVAALRPHRAGGSAGRASRSSRSSIAGLAIVVFNAIMGGDATFKQVFAVVAHSGVIITVQQLFALPLAYVRESLSSTTNLAVFAPFLDETLVRRARAGLDRSLHDLVDRQPRDRPRRALQAAAPRPIAHQRSSRSTSRSGSSSRPFKPALAGA